MKYFIKEYKTRYFAGLEFPGGIKPNSNDYRRIPELWGKLMNQQANRIPGKTEPNHFIGLEIYPFDFMETGMFDYYALAEIDQLVETEGKLVTKKLKEGRYICFPIKFDEIRNEIQDVYNFIKEKKINVHMGFDYEDYLVGENYGEPGAILNFCLLLEEDVK